MYEIELLEFTQYQNNISRNFLLFSLHKPKLENIQSNETEVHKIDSGKKYING